MRSVSLALVLLCLAAPSGEAEPTHEDVHRLADLALAITLTRLDASLDSSGVHGVELEFLHKANAELLMNRRVDASFGALSAQLDGPDLEPGRFHEPGRTIWEQLSGLPRASIETRWRELASPAIRRAVLARDSEVMHLLNGGEANVVSNYILLHLIALRFAHEAAGLIGTQEFFGSYRLALLYEAGAEGYLRASFFAGHMNVPFGSLWKLHGENTRRAHDHSRDTGHYVMNGRGQVWQTFGDEILASHAPTYRFILEASMVSLHELLLVIVVAIGDETTAARLAGQARAQSLVWQGDTHLPFLPDSTWDEIQERVTRWTAPHDAPETYYDSEGAYLPSLRLLPVPVAAASAVREADGSYSSKRYLQLRDEGYHDPLLTEEEVETLPFRNQYPSGMSLRLWDGAMTSVLYPRDETYPPSFLGLRADVGLAQLSGESGTTIGVAAGLGYAWSSGLYDLSARAGYLSGNDDGFLTLSFGPRFENPFVLPGLQWIEAFLPEIGYVHDLRGSWSESGGSIGVSGVTRAWSGMTSFVNAGPALQVGARLYVRKLPLIGVFAALGFQ